MNKLDGLNKLGKPRPRGVGVSSKMGSRFVKLLEQGILRDRTKVRSDGHASKATIPLPKALQVGRKPA